MCRLTAVCFLIAGIAGSGASAFAAELPEPQVLRGWIEEMKAADRGPFARIRWFCKDGTILPPKSYACQSHGGGVQHGEWNQRVKQLRAGGYAVASLLADLDVQVRTIPARGWLRISVGYWNDESDLERLLAGLEGVA